MKMNRSHPLFLKACGFGLLLFCCHAHAEYYVVTSAPTPEFVCVYCDRKINTNVTHHQYHHRHIHHRKHHYRTYHKNPNSVSVTVYYPYVCDGFSPCYTGSVPVRNYHVYSVQPNVNNDVDYDRATGDDDPNFDPDMDIDK